MDERCPCLSLEEEVNRLLQEGDDVFSMTMSSPTSSPTLTPDEEDVKLWQVLCSISSNDPHKNVSRSSTSFERVRQCRQR
mmetsp:Transcript_16671/g.24709  ORF Transcript_16671/g.24709 Transcript_16671/m.24709 type:complete len:80 (-) Transcript_16671:120-359(-)